MGVNPGIREGTSVFVSGTMQEFVLSSTIPGGAMSLNFDDKKVKSVKVKKGETVLYDGEIASFTDTKGEVFTGRSIGVKSAILRQGWLVLKSGEPMNIPTSSRSQPVPYNDLKGGEFEIYRKSDGLNRPIRAGKMEIVNQKDRIVGQHANAPVVAEEEGVVAMDSSPVATHVSSSTSVSRTASSHSTKILQSDNSSGAGASADMRTLPRKAAATQQKKKSYVVDDTTPRPVEDATLAEVQAATTVIDAPDGQNARVVKKIGQRSPEIQEVEGITLKKGGQPRESSGKATVTASSDNISMSGQDTTVVKKIGAPRASAVPTAFKKSEPPVTPAPQYERPNYQPVHKVVPLEVGAQRKPEFDSNLGGDFETSLKDKGLNDGATLNSMVGTPVVKTASAPSDDYISMLPDKWSDMHWVQKEKFVLSITDKAFLEFILSVETTPAIINACTKRLAQLEQEPIVG